MFTLENIRAATPGCAHRNHLNNAGAALPNIHVIRAVQTHLNLEAEIGGYEAADQMAPELAGFYHSMAQLLNTHARNIAISTSATDAYARALSAIQWKSGDVIVTTENDYVSNQIAFLSLQKRFEITLLRAKDGPDGGVDLTDIDRLIQQKHPKLVAVTHVPTNCGLVQPIEAIGAICQKQGCLYLVDACQSVGQRILDVHKIGCDFLSGTMRKFLRGPRGCGFLFASDRVLDMGLEMLLPDMRGGHWNGPDTYQPAPDARRFEYWEMSPALTLGSKAAIDYALQIGLDWIEDRVRNLAAQTRTALSTLPGVQLLDQGADLCGIVTAHSPDWEPKSLMAYLWARKINARTTPKYVAQIDFSRKGIDWALRISPHYFNTEQEIEEAVAALSEYRQR